MSGCTGRLSLGGARRRSGWGAGSWAAHRVHLDREEWTAAHERFSRCIDLAPRHALAWAGRGWAAFYIERDGATKAQETGIPLIDFFQALANADPYRQALNDLDRAIDIDPNLAIAYAWRGKVKRIRKDKKSGARDLQRARDLGWRGED